MDTVKIADYKFEVVPICLMIVLFLQQNSAAHLWKQRSMLIWLMKCRVGAEEQYDGSLELPGKRVVKVGVHQAMD